MSRTQQLQRARSYIGYAMLLVTAAQALLWIFPKPGTGLWSLFFLFPAGIFLLLTFRVADPRTPEPSHGLPAFVALLIMAVISFFGFLFIADGVRGLPTPLSILWQGSYLLWFPFIVAGTIVRWVLTRAFPSAAKKDAIDENRQREIVYEQRLQRELNSLSEPSAPGRMTGLEPAALEDVTLPDLPFMFGEPGVGLTGAGFAADAIAKGAAGELNFARALHKADLLSRFATFWSVHMPDEQVGASRKYQSDIDCVVVTGRSIVLLDMKNYIQGDVTWLMDDGQLRLVDNPTGGYVGGPRSMSRNMEFARSRVREKFEGLGVKHRIDARVVMMPTDNGVGTVDDVRWPGEIAVDMLDQTLARLGTEPDFDPADPASEHIVRVFRWLVKDESGSAPRLGEAWKKRRRTAPAASSSARPTAAEPVGAHPHDPSPTPRPGYAEPSPASGGTDAPASPSSAPAIPADRRTSAPAEQVSPAPAEGRTCVECGAAYQPEWTFCWECGHA